MCGCVWSVCGCVVCVCVAGWMCRVGCVRWLRVQVCLYDVVTVCCRAGLVCVVLVCVGVVVMCDGVNWLCCGV